MSFSDSNRTTILFGLSILLAVCQVINLVALIILFKAFLNLKRKILDYEKNLPSVRLDTPQCQRCKKTTAAAAAAAATVVDGGTGQERASGNWQLQAGEVAMRVPTPEPRRRYDCTVAVPRTLSTSGQKLLDLNHDGFESFDSPRDSGTGTASTRSPHSSISYESQKTMKESFSTREESSTLPKTRSRESQRCMSHDQSTDVPFDTDRTSSSASCGATRPARYGAHSLRFPSKEPLNENDFRLSRLKTVSIEMVDLDDKKFCSNTKIKRASRALKEMDENEEEPSAIEDVGFDNEGYHGDHAPSNRNSSDVSKLAPLACEESVSSLNSESVPLEISNNGFENPDHEEKYVNQEIVDAMRNDSIESRTNDGKHHEPIYVNQSAQP